MAKTTVVVGNSALADERGMLVEAERMIILVGNQHANSVVARFFDRTRWLDTYHDVTGSPQRHRNVT